MYPIQLIAGVSFMKLTGNAEKRIPCHSEKSDVETKNLDRFCKVAIDTQSEKGTLLTRLVARYSPYDEYEERFAT